MHDEADRIRELLANVNIPGRDQLPDVDEPDDGGSEGGVVLREQLRRERDPKLRRKKLEDVKCRGLPIACEVCTFDFSRFYGTHGLDYIEVHHRTPLAVTGKTRTRISDLALLCSNCHRMIHRSRQWLTVEELVGLVAAQRPGADE